MRIVKFSTESYFLYPSIIQKIDAYLIHEISPQVGTDDAEIIHSSADLLVANRKRLKICIKKFLIIVQNNLITNIA